MGKRLFPLLSLSRRVNYLVSMNSLVEEQRTEISSKERILHAAQTIFAQKGFEGSRVDEIARQAGVNKALIYYYFKSKEEILHALVHHAIEDFLAHIDNPLKLQEKMFHSEKLLHETMIQLLFFIEERKDLFTIVIAELLKDTERRSLILGHFNEELLRHDKYFPQFRAIGDARQSLVTEFFTGFLPFIMFVLLKEPWKRLYDQDEAELREMFLKAFEATHIRYTLDLLKTAEAGGKEGAEE
jgi:TetR/AcrR family transcriptional regulator